MGRILGTSRLGSDRWRLWVSCVTRGSDPAESVELREAVVDAIRAAGVLQSSTDEGLSPSGMLELWQAVLSLLQDDDSLVRGSTCALVLGLDQETGQELSGYQLELAIHAAHRAICSRC